MGDKSKRKELNIQIGARIKASREIARMTQEGMADAIDVTVQYVSDLERGKTGASIFTLSRICSVLQVSADYLLFGKRTPNDLSDIIYRLEYLSEKELSVVEDGIDVILAAMMIHDKH